MTFSQPIAIIGMGCRYPDSSNPEEFWRNQRNGRQSFAPVDPRRWDHSRFYTTGRDPDSTHCDRVAHLRNIEYFAASHFQISPRRAEVMDPQQRLLLETTWEALQDAGLRPQDYDRQRSAVYVGCTVSEYSGLASARLRERQMLAGQFGVSHDPVLRTQRVAGIRSYTLPGNMVSMVASVLSHAFDWGGPCAVLDGACASSLLALHQACLYLQDQTGDGLPALALAAGAYINLLPDNLVGFSRIGALATRPSSAFDQAANGFSLGEGVGVVILKRLDQALRDGDRIYAVVRNSVCNSDGTAPSTMTPSLEGQKRLLAQGLRECGLQAADLGYLECHGTGSPVADHVELQAWKENLGEVSEKPWIGSVKSNLGHSISAAGLASLMRAALAIYHSTIPPHAGWSDWHPSLEDVAQAFRVPTQAQPWEQAHRRAAVNSFAFGGINVMALLEEAPSPPSVTPAPPQALPVVLSAPDADLLEHFCQQLGSALQGTAWSDVAYTLTVLRPREREARLLWASNREELLAGLENPGALPVLPEDQDFRSHFEGLRLRVADLPPTPLQRKPFWVISSTARNEQHGHHERQVREWLARTCGCAPGDFQPEQHLIEDLGLDSLALRDLLTLLPPLENATLACSTWTVGELLEQCRLSEQAFRGGKLSPRTHPFLLDHALDKTMLLPLASGLDFLAWSQNLQAPLSLYDVKVHRGLMFREQTEIRLDREEDTIRLHEVRSGGKEVLSISARVGDLGQPPAYPEAIRSDWDLQGTLDRFYEEVTFHGSRLQGISNLLRASGQGVVGVVRTSVPSEWASGDPRPRWHLDPLVIDSCLQLALYWVHQEYQRPVLPCAISEISLLTQFAPGLVEAHVYALPLNEEGPSADILLYQNQRLVGWIRRVQSRWVKSLAKRSWQALPSEWTEVAELPEVVEHQQRLASLGPGNPYFQVTPPESINFCHYNYVGLAQHPEVLNAAVQAVQQHGCSAQASRLVGGEISLHRRLESGLARFLRQDDCLALVGGHATNVTLLAHWMESPDLILHDSLSHNSILQGAQASQARRLSFPHNDTAALEAILRKVRTRFRRVLIVVEGIYSMDGDIAPLPELVRLKHQYGCLLMVDEAHSLGVLGKTGRGICEHFEVASQDVDLLMGTLSKTLASCGGYLAGSKPLIDYLRYTLPGFVYSVGLSPPLAGSALAALELLEQEPERVEKLRQNSQFFWQGCQDLGLPLGTSQATPVVPIILGDSLACAKMCRDLQERGIEVKPIVYPAVEESASRLRFFLSSRHTTEQLGATLQALRELTSVLVRS